MYATLRSPTHPSSASPLPAHTDLAHNEALVGSPSMGSLGLVDTEPMRKVRNNSEHSPHSPTSSSKAITATVHIAQKSPVKSQRLPSGSSNNNSSALNNATAAAVTPRYVTNVTVGASSGAATVEISSNNNSKSPVYKRPAPTAQPECFDSSRSPSINSRDSPQQIHAQRKAAGSAMIQELAKQQSHSRLQEVRVYNNLGRTVRTGSNASEQHSIESVETENVSSSTSHTSMEQALNEQKLVTLLDASSSHHPISARPRRQLPKTPEMQARSNTFNSQDCHVTSQVTPTSPFHQRQKLPPHHHQRVVLSGHSPLQNGNMSPTTSHHHQHHTKGPHAKHTSPAMQRQQQHLDSNQGPTHGQNTSVDRTNEEYYRTIRRDKDKTPDRELQTWDYKKTVYLQESCV